MTVYQGLNGKTYNTGTKLGEGGEGTVYEINGESDKVIKLYNPEKLKNRTERAAKERKLKSMLGMKIQARVDGVLRLAWPLDILYERGKMVGFVMYKMSNMLKIYDIQRCWRGAPNDPSTKAVLAVYPKFTWKYSVQFAYNLAWVVDYVHSHGIVIGDLNQNNIYADTSTGAVVLIDCDSFDIRDAKSGERFPCEVGLQEILAPELQTVGQLAGNFTEATDNFSLAVHIFRLLMRNANPFGGVPSAGASSSAVTTANVHILNGDCPYIKKCTLTVPGWAPDFSILPPSIQNLFRKTFEYTAVTAKSKINKRATAAEWRTVLAVFAAVGTNPNLTTCTRNPYHVYTSHNTICPWCKCEGYVPPKIQPVHTAVTTSGSAYGRSSSSGTAVNGTSQSPAAGKRSFIPSWKPTSVPNAFSSIVSAAQPRSLGAKAKQFAGSLASRLGIGKGTGNTANTKIRRKAYLFYVLLAAFGLASGFVFGGLTAGAVNAVFGTAFGEAGMSAVLSAAGVIGGLVLAYLFEDQYTRAMNAFPWLFMSGVAFLIPLLFVLVIGAVIFVILLIAGIVLSILAVIFLMFFLCSCLSGS